MNKTFLKWAGNKQRIIKHILPLLEQEKHNRLIEPFVGSGSLFLNSEFEEYVLSDINETLIDLYAFLKEQGEDYVSFLNSFFTPENNTLEMYYRLREDFNTTSDRYRRSALFLYFNKHAFNGLCRFNGKGEFNVPFGYYKEPKFPEKELREFLLKLKKANVILLNKSYEDVLKNCKMGDVVYCDPPYIPLSASASFTKYSTKDFNLSDQKNLGNELISLQGKGIKSVISNHDCELAREIYKGATIHTLNVSRTIAAKGASRKAVGEILAEFVV